MTSNKVPSSRTWIGRPAKPPRSDHRLRKKKCFTRSARTRRSIRRRRVELSGAGAESVQYGVVRNLHLVQCSVDSVKHDSSPSHRDCSRRVLRVAGGSTSVRRFRTPGCSGRYADVPQSVLVCCLQASRPPSLPLAGACFPYSKCAKRCALRLRNLDKKQPFSYCYEFTNSASPGKRRYVHTAADLHVRPWFSNRAGLESLGRREPFRDTPWVISDNPLNQGARRLFVSVAALQLRALKATV
jgi:hypothetical protein